MYNEIVRLLKTAGLKVAENLRSENYDGGKVFVQLEEYDRETDQGFVYNVVIAFNEGHGTQELQNQARKAFRAINANDKLVALNVTFSYGAVPIPYADQEPADIAEIQVIDNERLESA